MLIFLVVSIIIMFLMLLMTICYIVGVDKDIQEKELKRKSEFRKLENGYVMLKSFEERSRDLIYEVSSKLQAKDSMEKKNEGHK